jgi:hypothetical protein
MDVLKNMAMLETLKLEFFKYGKIEDLQAQEVDSVCIFTLEFRNVVLSRGCNISFKTTIKSAH